VNSPPPKPEVILTNFFAEPTVLLVPITSRGCFLGFARRIFYPALFTLLYFIILVVAISFW
jgi:hypothetical protein